MATAGRTVAVSGLTVTVGAGRPAAVPAGLPAVDGRTARCRRWSVAMLASLTVLPAGLALLGTGSTRWRVPLPTTRSAADGGRRCLGAARAQRDAAAVDLPRRRADRARRCWPRRSLHIPFGGLDTRALAGLRAGAGRDRHDRPGLPDHGRRAPVQVLVDRCGRGHDWHRLTADIRGDPGVTAATVAATAGTDTLLIASTTAARPTDPTARDVGDRDPRAAGAAGRHARRHRRHRRSDRPARTASAHGCRGWLLFVVVVTSPAAVPRVRLGGAADQGDPDERGVARRGVRRRGLHLPGGPLRVLARLHRRPA